MNVVASSPEGLEKYLAEEIANLGGFNINTHKRFIKFECDFDTFYRVHFYSRIAFRFYREIASFNCYDKQSLYEGVRDSCLLYTSPSPRDDPLSRMPSSA